MILDVVPLRRALLSVSDKTGLVELGRALADKGCELLSTGGTAKALRDAGLTVKDVSEHTGFPEMLDGRVKTLHPKIHGGLLGRRGEPSHVEAMKQHDIAPIDLVVVNLYPFEKIAGQVDASWEELIENIDIGGPSMLRSAAKNHEAVAVVTDPSDYPDVLAALSVAGGTTAALRVQLALKAFQRTARYDAAIAARLALKVEQGLAGDQIEPCATKGMGPVFAVVAERTSSLRYGENPHQMAAVYVPANEAPLNVAGAVPLQGKELSYNNLLDADAAVFALRCVQAPGSAAAVIIKHNTPCGAARGQSAAEAWARALASDPTSAFGGIVAFNVEVDDAAAQAMAETFLEVIVAPSFSAAARERLSKKTALRLLAVADVATAPLPHLQVRSIMGGLLVQEHDTVDVDVRAARVVTKRAPNETEWAALEIACRLSAAVKSNAITLCKDAMLLGAGGGQTSRVDSVKLALQKAREHGHDVKGAALGSDAFFPFADGLLVAAEAGIKAVAQPGGSKRDSEVIAAADAHDIAMVFTDQRHFRH